MANVIKITVSLSLDVTLWHLFRDICRKEGLTPSHEVEACMRAKLAEWLHLPSAVEKAAHPSSPTRSTAC